MSPTAIIILLLSYFGLLLILSYFTSKGADNQTFFIGNRQSPWYLVAFGMIGTSLSGVTFISVPAWVESSQFSYMQMVLGYLLGYVVIAFVLLPLYYSLQLTSIYKYLEQRFGYWSYKTGAFYFILSRSLGASFRLYLVATVLQLAIFDAWGVPYWVSVAVTILLIWVYTFKGGIKTIVWTDSLQTLFMLAAVGITIWQIGGKLNLEIGQIAQIVSDSEYSKTFFFEDWKDSKFFWKQFISGAFITIVMTGLDQDMMQKNLSIRNLKEAQWNIFSFSTILVLVNVFFLSLGALLFIYANHIGLSIPEKTDEIYPLLALKGYLGPMAAFFFILGLTAAAYSSADSALTALTTSVCIDLIDVQRFEEAKAIRIRKRVHLLMSLLLFVIILIFSLVNDENVISSLFKAAGYTYGPLLGMYAFGMIHKKKVLDKGVPFVCLIAPFLTYGLQYQAPILFNGYQFGYEIIVINGFITYLGLAFLSSRFIYAER
ncbi:MAG: sodium:solute symporter [Flavobacteriales bacterium]|nr:sodium:solute symporter [Flavobacteriales bacterium]|tara:strand:- start:281 stop:1741 length:1461 start_codon:yes stop_codon:yes gene_type:complete